MKFVSATDGERLDVRKDFPAFFASDDEIAIQGVTALAGAIDTQLVNPGLPTTI